MKQTPDIKALRLYFPALSYVVENQEPRQLKLVEQPRREKQRERQAA